MVRGRAVQLYLCAPTPRTADALFRRRGRTRAVVSFTRETSPLVQFPPRHGWVTEPNMAGRGTSRPNCLRHADAGWDPVPAWERGEAAMRGP